MDQIQGRDTKLVIYRGGKVVKGITVKNFDHESDSQIRKRNLIGERRASRQTLIEGWKGRVSFDVDSGRAQEINDYLERVDLAGTEPDEIAIQVRERYRDGSTKSFRYVKAALKPASSRAPGQMEDLEGVFEWEAERRVQIR